MPAAAFFDVDGTALTVQSGILYIGYLRRHGLMSLADQLRIYWAYLTYKLGMLNMAKLVDVTSRWIRERAESDVADHCREWYQTEIRRYLRSDIVRLVNEHRDAGHEVALLTSGTKYLNDHVAADLGVEHVLCSALEVVDGRFTGKPLEPLCFGRGKVVHAERFAEARGIRLEDCYYYGDSIHDRAMLAAVGQPRVVNPDPRLRVEARQRGWQVLELSSSCPFAEEPEQALEAGSGTP